MHYTGDEASRPPRTAAQAAEDTGRRIAAALTEFPDWDFREVFGGWEAVPKGTRVVRGMDLASVVEKLREQR